MKLVTVSQMREIEKEADANGLPYAEMMENAARGIAETINDLAFDTDWEEALGLVGSGNNGGDTLLALTRLAEEGWRACAYVCKRNSQDKLVLRLQQAGGEVIFAESDKHFSNLTAHIQSADVMLDGLLGTGVKLPLKNEISALLAHALFVISDVDQPPYVVAVDCPSGVDCDSGETARECISADLTITMAAVKQGLLKLPAYEFMGDLALVDIGLPDDLKSFDALKIEVADYNLVAGLLPERPADAHKGTFGAALIAAGSLNYSGAALLAGAAAYRAGAGLVTLAVPEPLHAALAGHLPEATWVLLPHESGCISATASEILLNHTQRSAAFLFGPGIGNAGSVAKFVELTISKQNLPTVVDADGLRHLACISDWHKKIPADSILTPHIGEMSALTGLPRQQIQAHKNEIALQYAKEWGHVVVLKGAFTVVAAPDGRATLVPIASPALARAGTGDVLAGIIVGLRAQGLDAYSAAVAGAFIHAEAGLIAAEDLGCTASVLAGDVLSSIADIMSRLE